MKIPISFKNTLISYFWGYHTTIPNRRCGGAIPKEKAKLGREVASKQLTLRLCFIASEKIFKKCSKFQPSRESATGGTLPTVPGPETRQGRLRTLSPPNFHHSKKYSWRELLHYFIEPFLLTELLVHQRRLQQMHELPVQRRRRLGKRRKQVVRIKTAAIAGSLDPRRVHPSDVPTLAQAAQAAAQGGGHPRGYIRKVSPSSFLL